MVENISGVYMIRNRINQRAYIGSSAHILNRIKFHLARPDNPNLKKDIVEMGLGSFMFTILEFVFKDDLITNEDFYDKLLNREQFYLDSILKANSDRDYFHRSAYNINYYASGPKGITRSAASRKKMSETRMGRKPTQEAIQKGCETRIKNHIEKIELTYGSMDVYHAHLREKKRIRRNKNLCTTSHGGIPIACFDLNGKFIKRFDNQTFANLEFGIPGGNISRAINRKCVCKSMYWTLYTKGCEVGFEVESPLKYLLKDAKGNEIGKFKSVLSMAKKIGVHHASILNYLKRANCVKLFKEEYSIDEI